jgi:hypothetical protein
MKTLIHSNGKMIIINKIARSEDMVYFTNYDNGVLMKAGIVQVENPSGKSNIDKNIVPTTYMKYNDYLDWVAEESVLIDKPTYTLAGSNNVNWVFNKSLGNANTTVRVYIPFEQLGASDQAADALSTWMTSKVTEKAYRTTGKMGIVQYLISLTQGEIDMFALYPTCIIDYKA